MFVQRFFNFAILSCPWKFWSCLGPLSKPPESTSLQISLVNMLHPSARSTFRMSPQHSHPSTSQTSHIFICAVRMSQPRWIRSWGYLAMPLDCEMFSSFAVARLQATYPSPKSPSAPLRISHCGFMTQFRSSSTCGYQASRRFSWNCHSTHRK